MATPDPPSRPRTAHPPADAVRRSRSDLSATVGWALVGLITLTVLVTWSPSLTAGLGDNHEGRILARHALNVQNAQADGLAASGWLSDWSPYAGSDQGDQTSYAHHPPLMNLGYYLTGQALPVRLDTAMRLFSYLSGLALLPIGAAVLRRLGFRWVPVLVATVAIAVTPLFWVYGRLSGAVTLLLAMTLVIVRLREDRPISDLELGVAAVICLAAVVAGYLGLAAAALLGLALLATRGVDRVTVVIGAAMALGAAITAAYVLGGTGISAIGDQVQLRTQGGAFTAGEFLTRIGRWATELLPAWWRWLLLPLALIAGTVDRRSRALTLLLTVVAAAYIFGLPNGSFIHDYWIFPVLLPVWVGTAALATGLGELARGRADAVLVGVGVLILLVGIGGLVRAEVPATYLGGPEAAGDLARATSPAADQRAAWRTDGLAAPRWLSLYWDLPPAVVERDGLDAVGADHLVFVALDRVPPWLDAGELRATAVDREGGYAVVTGDHLRRLADEGGETPSPAMLTRDDRPPCWAITDRAGWRTSPLRRAAGCRAARPRS